MGVSVEISGVMAGELQKVNISFTNIKPMFHDFKMILLKDGVQLEVVHLAEVMDRAATAETHLVQAMDLQEVTAMLNHKLSKSLK
jgi:hypothetical protein